MLIELPFGFEGKIYRSPMPFSKFDRSGVWGSFLDHKIDLVLVLTEPQEYLVFAQKDLPDFYRKQGLEVLHLPVPDFGIPADMESWNSALLEIAEAARSGKNIAVHCLAGIGRTGTFLACLARDTLNLDGRTAIEWVRDHLPGALESTYQEDFVYGRG
jgi:atypical dual specificity phosphatase